MDAPACQHFVALEYSSFLIRQCSAHGIYIPDEQVDTLPYFGFGTRACTCLNLHLFPLLPRAAHEH